MTFSCLCAAGEAHVQSDKDISVRQSIWAQQQTAGGLQVQYRYHRYRSCSTFNTICRIFRQIGTGTGTVQNVEAPVRT